MSGEEVPAEERDLGQIALAEQEDPVDQENPETVEHAKHEELSIGNVQQLQREDPDLQPLICYLEWQELPDDLKLSQCIVLEAGQMDLDKDGLL